MATPVPSPRLVRRYRQLIDAAPLQVFELLCPERETEWLPGWRYTMIHSTTGFAEPGAVFATGDGAARVIWVTVDHEPSSHVRFVRWHPDAMVVEIDLHVSSADGGRSNVDVQYTYTAVSAAGAQSIAAIDEARWLEQMHGWENAMNDWLARRHRSPGR